MSVQGGVEEMVSNFPEGVGEGIVGREDKLRSGAPALGDDEGNVLRWGWIEER